MDEQRDRLAWFSEEILPHAAGLRRCLARLGVRACDVEDYVAETMLRAYSHRDWRGVERSKSFLFQIARNLVRDAVRRREIARFDLVADMDALGLADQTPSPEALLCQQQRRELLRDAIERLPLAQQELVRLRWLKEMPVECIAQHFGLCVSTVEKRLAAAFFRIRKDVRAAEAMDARATRLAKALRRDTPQSREGRAEFHAAAAQTAAARAELAKTLRRRTRQAERLITLLDTHTGV
jgi:RNA polymerase sigma-70 factor (ECF subfamily)